jgi:hypothetical protein
MLLHIFQYQLHKTKDTIILLTANGIAVVIGDDSNPGAHHDIILKLHQIGAKKCIYDTYPAYQPLVYILLFP